MPHRQRAPAYGPGTASALGAHGATADSLSPSVLVLGLEIRGDDPLSRALREMVDAVEPFAVTLSQLQRWPVDLAARDIYVFENPSILMEAMRSRCGSALVCLSGWPNTAGLTLLRQLADTGCTLYYHGDFDPPGLRIVLDLISRLGVRPWRMSAGDYLKAAGCSEVVLDERVPATAWDVELARSMEGRRRVVFEEDVAEELLSVLRDS